MYRITTLGEIVTLLLLVIDPISVLSCDTKLLALVSVRYGLNTNIICTLITCVHISHNALVLCHLSIVSIAPALLLTVEHFDDDQLGQVNWTPHASKPHTIVEIFNCKLPIFSTYNIHNTYMYEMLQLVSLHFLSYRSN